MALRAEEGEEAKGRKDESGYGPEVDAVAAATRRLVPKDNARDVRSQLRRNAPGNFPSILITRPVPQNGVLPR